jgi:hypothetical protein
MRIIEPIKILVWDGLSNTNEGEVYDNFATEPDPAGDDYTFYLNTSGSILERYKIIMELMEL